MTRKTKISCDVTREADNMLKDYCKKHERSKGYLIEKMIRKFCVDVEPVKKPKPKTKRFIPPSVEQVKEYCESRGNKIDPENFVDHYTTNGWMRGNTKIKDWKACVRTWEKNNKGKKFSYNKESIDYDDRSWADNFKLRIKN